MDPRVRFDTARGLPKWTKIFAHSLHGLNDGYVRYFIIYVMASSLNRRARSYSGLFIRQISAGYAIPAKPDTAYGNVPEPTGHACEEGGAQG